MHQEAIIIRFGDHDLDEYEFSPKSSVKEEPPAYLVEAAHLIMMNKEPGFDLGSIPEDVSTYLRKSAQVIMMESTY